MDANTAQKQSKAQTLSGCTFDGVPFTVALDYSRTIDNGATARIYKGKLHCSQPLTLSPNAVIGTNQPFIVAVKVFGQILSEAQQELIVRELRVARHVSSCHTLILPFLGTVDVGPQTAIVSPFMRNGNLMEYIKAHKGCDKNKLIRQVAEAVNFLHTSRNLVHGDIKCANVLISNFGDALLADFGLSTFIEQNQAALPTMTAIRNMYTLRFAAPELLTGGSPPGAVIAESFGLPTAEHAESALKQRSKTRESDVYALGMLVLEVATENPPWHGLSPAAVVLRVTAGQHPPRPLNGSLVSMSHMAWELCLKCWRTVPAERIKMENALDILKTEGFDIGPGKIIKTRGFPNSIAYMPSGRHVVTGSWSGDLHIWDTRTGLAIVGPMRGHTSSVACVAVSRNGLEIASSSFDKTICRWHAASGTPIGEPINLQVAACCIAYSPDGRYLAGGEGSHVRLWRAAASGVSRSTYKGHEHSRR